MNLKNAAFTIVGAIICYLIGFLSDKYIYKMLFDLERVLTEVEIFLIGFGTMSAIFSIYFLFTERKNMQSY
jgi:uncharacterized protein YacL